MAYAIIGGLIVATLVTLTVLPASFSLLLEGGYRENVPPLNNTGWPGATPVGVLYEKKKPVLAYELFLKNMAVRGIRTPRYVAAYTLSRRAPSATRTPHHIVLSLTLGGQRGATIGSCAKTVKQYLCFRYRSVKRMNTARRSRRGSHS